MLTSGYCTYLELGRYCASCVGIPPTSRAIAIGVRVLLPDILLLTPTWLVNGNLIPLTLRDIYVLTANNI